jgi:hypothetical protein
MHVVAVGGSDAGISAALRARELDPGVEVTVVVADAYPNYSICGIPCYVSGDVTHWQRLAHRTRADLEVAGVDLHMLFGYLLVRNLMILVKVFSRLPDGWSRRFAALLNAGTRPFHVVNYVGSLGGARVLGYSRMVRVMDRVVAGLVSRLERERPTALGRGMHFPVGWDPYFLDYMTRADVYHYATQHYLHHRGQLTLAAARRGDGAAPAV